MKLVGNSQTGYRLISSFAEPEPEQPESEPSKKPGKSKIPSESGSTGPRKGRKEG